MIITTGKEMNTITMTDEHQDPGEDQERRRGQSTIMKMTGTIVDQDQETKNPKKSLKKEDLLTTEDLAKGGLMMKTTEGQVSEDLVDVLGQEMKKKIDTDLVKKKGQGVEKGMDLEMILDQETKDPGMTIDLEMKPGHEMSTGPEMKNP